MLTSGRDFVELIVLLSLLGGAAWAVWRVQRDRRVATSTRTLLALAAIALGVGLCFLPYQPSASRKLIGMPLPLVVFQLEQGHWVDYLTSPERMAVIGSFNVLLVAGITHGIVPALLAWRRKRLTSKDWS